MKKFILYILSLVLCCFIQIVTAQDKVSTLKKLPDALYGTASYYADKFNGRPTANGEVFSQNKLTAACNVLPLGTWIRVTNLKNGKTIIVKVNDRLHPKMKRVVDLTKAGARLLGYTNGGLTKVKVEPLVDKPTAIK